MGNPQRIPVEAIQAMKKILDALPDKNLGKTKEEALTMLGDQIRRAYAKGYSAKELARDHDQGQCGRFRAHTPGSHLSGVHQGAKDETS